MSLSALFSALGRDEQIDVPAGWAQGRATAGSLVGALLYARIAALLDDSRTLRSATVAFVGPLAVGPATVKAALLRRGKSVTQAESRIIQNGEVVAVMQASLGAARDSALRVAAETGPVFKHPDACAALPYISGVTPEFMQHIDFRWGHGDFPFTGSALPELGGWMRFKEGRGAIDAMDLFLLVDAWPPALLPAVKGLASGSSLCWTLEPVYWPKHKTANSWWQYRATTDYAQDGYGNVQARLWDDEGNLVAISRQTVVVFA